MKTRKIVKKLYSACSYIMFFLVVYSLLLNLTCFITKIIFGHRIIDWWELLYIPLIITFEVKYYQPLDIFKNN